MGSPKSTLSRNKPSIKAGCAAYCTLAHSSSRGISAHGLPSSETDPSAWRRNPPRIFSSVLLPQPDAPTMAHICPGLNTAFTPSSTGFSPSYEKDTPFSANASRTGCAQGLTATKRSLRSGLSRFTALWHRVKSSSTSLVSSNRAQSFCTVTMEAYTAPIAREPLSHSANPDAMTINSLTSRPARNLPSTRRSVSRLRRLSSFHRNARFSSNARSLSGSRHAMHASILSAMALSSSNHFP